VLELSDDVAEHAAHGLVVGKHDLVELGRADTGGGVFALHPRVQLVVQQSSERALE